MSGSPGFPVEVENLKDEEFREQIKQENRDVIAQQELDQTRVIEEPRPRETKIAPAVTRNPLPSATISNIEATNRRFTRWDYSVSTNSWSLQGTYEVTLENTSAVPVFNVTIDTVNVSSKLESFIDDTTREVEILDEGGISVGQIPGGSSTTANIDFSSNNDRVPGIANPVTSEDLDSWPVSTEMDVSGVVLTSSLSKSDFEVPILNSGIDDQLDPTLDGPGTLDVGETGTYTLEDATLAEKYLFKWEDNDGNEDVSHEDNNSKDLSWNEEPGTFGFITVTSSPTTDMGHVYSYAATRTLFVNVGEDSFQSDDPTDEPGYGF